MSAERWLAGPDAHLLTPADARYPSLLREIQSETLILALKGAPVAVTAA